MAMLYDDGLMEKNNENETKSKRKTKRNNPPPILNSNPSECEYE